MTFVIYNNTTDEFLSCLKDWDKSFFYAKTFPTHAAARDALNKTNAIGTARVVSYRLLDSKTE